SFGVLWESRFTPAGTRYRSRRVRDAGMGGLVQQSAALGADRQHPAGRSRGTLLRHAGTTCHGGVTQTKWPPTNPGRFTRFCWRQGNTNPGRILSPNAHAPRNSALAFGEPLAGTRRPNSGRKFNSIEDEGVIHKVLGGQLLCTHHYFEWIN